MPFCDNNMYAYQAELIRAGKCYNCRGEKTARAGEDYHAKCQKCGGTGLPTEEDLERLKVHEQGICLICKLPLVEGHEDDTESKYAPSGVNDCLDHLRQYVMKLEQEKR